MARQRMNELRLAQLFSPNIPNDRKLEILKNLDITCTISCKSAAFQEETAFLGYNCLHIAAMRSDLFLTQKLLNLGANLLQRGVQDNKTPLRRAVDGILEYGRALHGRSLVNTLLSAQVKSDNPLNAKCKSGVSHFHIASMFNHVDAVMFFARSKESINLPIRFCSDILPGYTPLHCAIRYSATEAAVILMTLGADMYLENAEGINSVCYLIERLLGINDYLKCSHRHSHEEETERLDSILKVIVLKHKSDDTQLVQNTGLSAFHLACALKNKWIMQSCIENDFKDFNKPVTCKSKLWSGWTPLHFAICCNAQTFRLLLKNGADINIRNAKGETAFDLYLQKYRLEIPLSYLSFDTSLSDRITKLSNLMVALNSDTCLQFLQNLENIDINVPLESPFWPGYNLLHVSILMIHRNRLSHAFHQEIDYCSKTGHLVHVPADHRPQDASLPWARFESIWRKGCNVYAKNADGLTPIHLAFQLDEWHVAEELLALVDEDIVDSGNLSLFHIAYVMGKTEVVERLLEKGADVNSRITKTYERYGKPQTYSKMGYQNKLRRAFIRANSTSLHIAVLFDCGVWKLLENHADIHAEDELGLTPLHLTLIVSEKWSARVLFQEASSNLKDVRTKDGLSYLHVAAFADDEEAVRKLLLDGVDVNGFVKDTAPECLSDFVGKTPLHLAVESEKAARVLMENRANILAENPYKKFCTPLDLAMKNLNSNGSKFPFDKLKGDEIRIDAMTTSGLTTLHIACATLDLDWTRKLLERGANPNAKMRTAEGQANTPMHLVIERATSTFSLPEHFRSFLELLVDHGADVNVSNDCKTPLHLIVSAYFKKRSYNTACKTILLTIGDWLLSNLKTYALNYQDADGFSNFHFACVSNNLQVVKKYFNNGVDVNHSTSPFARNHGGFTALHFAIIYKNLSMVQLLLERGADVKVENTNGDTPLHLAVEHLMNFQLFDALLRRGANINAKNLNNAEPITYLLSRGNMTYEQFRFFVNRGSLINIRDTINGQGTIGFTMGHTNPNDIDSVFETLIELTNVKDAINKGFLAIHNAVSVNGRQDLTCEKYLDVIQRLTAKGSDIDEEDQKGMRALDKAISFGNSSAIKALLLLGANVNVIEDENGHSSIVHKSWYPHIPEVPDSRMTKHLWKMAFFKLDLSISIQRAMRNEEWKPDDDTMKLYQAELEKIENSRINQNLTAKHFLSEWGAVIEYPTMSVAKRQAADDFFNRADNLRKEFPQFAGLLTMQYRKALARVKLMQPVKDILVEAGIDLPDLCLEAILKYFKNAELNFLIDNADEMSQPRKRQRIQ